MFATPSPPPNPGSIPYIIIGIIVSIHYMIRKVRK